LNRIFNLESVLQLDPVF